jgi:hypothetical protein
MVEDKGKDYLLFNTFHQFTKNKNLLKDPKVIIKIKA